MQYIGPTQPVSWSIALRVTLGSVATNFVGLKAPELAKSRSARLDALGLPSRKTSGLSQSASTGSSRQAYHAAAMPNAAGSSCSQRGTCSAQGGGMDCGCINL